MQLPQGVSAANLHALAKLVSNAGLQRILFDDNFMDYGKHMKNLLSKNGFVIKRKCTLSDILQYSFALLSNNYRHEYLYKTAILNSYVLNHHSLADTILLNEFKIGNSKADTVLVNGTNKVFEIKTELDTPDRLKAQINDYYKAFSEVYVVVHDSDVKKYSQVIDAEVGLMTFDNNIINIHRDAKPDLSRLDLDVMIRALRKSEYLHVVKELSNEIPNSKPIFLFKTCLEILSQFSLELVHFEFLKAIKNRINPITNNIIMHPSLPDFLRLSCYYSNLDEKGYISIVNRLNYKV